MRDALQHALAPSVLVMMETDIHALSIRAQTPSEQG